MVDDEALRKLIRERAGLQAFVDRSHAWRAAVEVVTATVGDVAWIAEAGSDGEMTLRHLLGGRTDALRGLQIPLGHGLTGKVYVRGEACWVDDYFAAADITHTFDRHIENEGIRRLLAVPVRAEGRTLGVLAVGVRTDGTFGHRAVDGVSAVAEEVARAVAVADRARLARETAVHSERSRLAAELHDSVGALLFAIGSGASGLAESVSDDPVLRERIEQLQRHAVEASGALRESLRTLRASPAALELAVGLRADCVAFADRTGRAAELVMLDDADLTLPPGRAPVVLAAVREALLNVEKHADATAVVVTVSRRRDPDRLSVAVLDDGRGLGPDHVPGVGLTSTAEALARLGGQLSVTSEPFGGTTWRIELPC